MAFQEENSSLSGQVGRSARFPTQPLAQWAIALMLGALTVSGFAPDYLSFLPPLTLAALSLLWSRAASRLAAARVGFAFGLGFFGAGVSWVYVSIHDFGGMPTPIAVVATFLFCLVLSLFPAAAGLLQAGAGGLTRRRALLLIPAWWVAMEWVKGWILTGFPWLTLGYSQVAASPLAGFAPVLGVYGVSLAVALCAGALALLADAWLGRRGKAGMALPAVLILALAGTGWGLQRVNWVQPIGAPVTVSLLQGNIAQEMKWREDKAQNTLDAYLALTQASSGRLIVLPETALPMFLHQVPLSYLEMLAEHARRRGGDVLVGVPEYTESRDYFNSVVSLGSAPVQVYRKYHLVPFG
ncbi:MAG: apolipoprotein N-acyltransferase, partial [Sulfuricella sp.]|nr:apolipoprotein N-acyltransferase [Sulfuricella sp.]